MTNRPHSICTELRGLIIIKLIIIIHLATSVTERRRAVRTEVLSNETGGNVWKNIENLIDHQVQLGSYAAVYSQTQTDKGPYSYIHCGSNVITNI